MQMNDMRGTSPLMQVINVLCDNSHFMLFLQLCYHSMSFIRLHFCKLFTSNIIEIQTFLGVIV